MREQSFSKTITRSGAAALFSVQPDAAAGIETAAALAKVDRLTRQIIAAAAPVRFGIARTAAEREAAFRLRFRVALAAGWAQPGDFAGGLERDAYDDAAIHILAWEDDALVGTTRLVLPTDGRPLPTEEAFGVSIAARGRVADVGRICHAPGYRDLRYRVLRGLFSQAWIELRARGCQEVCAAMKGSMLRVCRSMGVGSTILGAARHYWGAPRYPVLIRPAASGASWR
jgi:hypothetical protein